MMTAIAMIAIAAIHHQRALLDLGLARRRPAGRRRAAACPAAVRPPTDVSVGDRWDRHASSAPVGPVGRIGRRAGRWLRRRVGAGIHRLIHAENRTAVPVLFRRCPTSSTRPSSTSRPATAARAWSRSGASRTCPKGGPDGGDGGKGGDVWLRANRNVASLLAFRDHPHRKAKSGTHGSGQEAARRRPAPTSSSTFPRAPSSAAFDGELLADLVADGDRWLAARGGRGGRGNARFLSNARRAPSFAEQGEYGEERWLQARAEAARRRRARRLPERGQVDADLGRERGQAQDRRLPVHHARAEPRRRAVPRARVRARRHPRPDRRRGRGQGPRPPVPAPRRTGACARDPARPRAGRRTRRRPSRKRCCSTSSGATGPTCSNGRASSSAPRPTSRPQRLRRPRRSPP